MTYSDLEVEAARLSWRPIEDAPRNSKWVLVWWEEITDCALVAYRKPDGKWHCPVNNGYDEGRPFAGPTHWMPLPSAPTSEAKP